LQPNWTTYFSDNGVLQHLPQIQEQSLPPTRLKVKHILAQAQTAVVNTLAFCHRSLTAKSTSFSLVFSALVYVLSDHVSFADQVSKEITQGGGYQRYIKVLKPCAAACHFAQQIGR